MDRNPDIAAEVTKRLVALRKESVDRNTTNSTASCAAAKVALRKESVDRNRWALPDDIRLTLSLSARRAWIEISRLPELVGAVIVALRKESVDRNVQSVERPPGYYVALRKESVDRNPYAVEWPVPPVESLSARRAWIEIQPAGLFIFACLCRSPQGERG